MKCFYYKIRFFCKKNIYNVRQSAPQIYNALIQPHLNYCSPIWDEFSNQLSNKLQKLQNHAARVIAKANYETSSNVLLEMLKWDSLSVTKQAKGSCDA